MTDSEYFKILSTELKIKDIHQLDIIMGPNELKQYLKDLTLSDFDNGRTLISLHTHTQASDGEVHPKDYLKNALKFKEQYGYKELILSITDHDTIDALPIILKEGIKNTEKYKGIRLILGCELSLSYFDSKLHRPVDFELLHYGINPFDKNYIRFLKSVRDRKTKALTPILNYFKNRYPSAGLNRNDFLTRFPRNRSGFGCYIAYDTPRYICETVNRPEENNEIWDFFRRLDTPLSDLPQIPFWYTTDEVLTQIKSHGFGFLSLAHPYRIQLDGKVREDGCHFMNRFLTYLKESGIQGLEIFYMNLAQPLYSSFKKITSGSVPISDTDYWVKTILNFAKENDMIKTGGTDSHTSFLGSRQKHLIQLLTQKLQSYKPLIRKGYQVLNKEVILGLPAPCMPAISPYHNTGIGSSYGAGAKRISDFFGGIFDKIQLGPMGQTDKESKHSPYVSDLKPNPFFIPLEYLAEDKLISDKTLQSIYDIPKSDNQIDFEQVEKSYTTALKEAYQTADTSLSYDDFIQSLVKRYQSRNSIKYIADLQVQIPQDTHESNDLFLKGFSLGSPPDNFSTQARNWHFKVFNPKQLFNKDGSLGPAGLKWYNLIDKSMKNATGGIRIDHYIGFVNPFVISDDDPTVFGRLYSSPHIPKLRPFIKSDFSDITEKILLSCAHHNGLTAKDIYVEDLGNRPEQIDDVMKKCHLGRMIIAQFAETNNPEHQYHLSRTQVQDVACLDTHDLPSVQEFFNQLSVQERHRFAMILSQDLRFNYTEDLCSPSQLVRMMWGALLACPAQRVSAFFTSWTGQEGRYNTPGYPIKWILRCDTNFNELYFKNLRHGLSYNPFDAISLAIYARGDDFYHRHENLVHQLRQAEEEILTLCAEL